MKNLFRIELPTQFGMQTVNSFLIRGDEVVLVDCGENTEASYLALEEGLKTHGLQFSDIDRILLTHAHVDHMGMAERTANAGNAEVWVSEKVLDWAIDPEKMWTQRESMMMPALETFFEPSMKSFIKEGYEQMMGNVKNVWEPISEDRLKKFRSEGDIEIDGQKWDVLYMPGHTQTQSTFYHPNSGSFLSADMLLRVTPTPVIERSIEHPDQRSKGIIQMIESYDRLLTLDIDAVYPGHYQLFDRAHEVVESQVSRIYGRAIQTFELIKKGHHSFFDLFRIMYEGRFSMPALIMMIGYLDLLEEQGKIQLQEIDGHLHITKK